MVGRYALIDSYWALNKSVQKVLDSVVELLVIEVPDIPPADIRLTQSTFDVAERMARVAPVVTAHDLSQYVNRFYSLDLEGSSDTWFDLLIEDEEDLYLGGLA